MDYLQLNIGARVLSIIISSKGAKLRVAVSPVLYDELPVLEHQSVPWIYHPWRPKFGETCRIRR